MIPVADPIAVAKVIGVLAARVPQRRSAQTVANRLTPSVTVIGP